MLREIYAHFYKQIVVRMSETGELAGTFVWPLIGILSLGLFGKYLIVEGASEAAIPMILIGVISWNFLGIATRAISFGILYDLWNNCMKHFFNTAIKLRYYVIGASIFALLSGLIAFFIVLGAISLIFGNSFIIINSYILFGFFVVMLHGIAQGMMVTSLFVSKGYNWQGLSWILPGIMMIICGVYYPISYLPESLQTISYLFPSTYAIQGMRDVVMGSLSVGQTNLLIGFLVSIAHLIFFSWTMKKAIQNGKKTGMIANY
jgi:ABC-2 type transport system permease protein